MTKFYLLVLSFSLAFSSLVAQEKRVPIDPPHELEGGAATVTFLLVTPARSGHVHVKGFSDKGLQLLETSLKITSRTVDADSLDFSQFFHPSFAAHGLRHGPHREWYGNGQLLRECTFRNGANVGAQRSWYPDGTLKSEHSPNGQVRIFGEDGTLRLEMERTERGVSNVRRKDG